MERSICCIPPNFRCVTVCFPQTSDLLQSLLSDPRYMESNGYQPVPVQSADVQVIVETTSFLVNSTNAADARVPLFPKDLNSTNNFLDVIAL